MIVEFSPTLRKNEAASRFRGRRYSTSPSHCQSYQGVLANQRQVKTRSAHLRCFPEWYLQGRCIPQFNENLQGRPNSGIARSQPRGRTRILINRWKESPLQLHPEYRGKSTSTRSDRHPHRCLSAHGPYLSIPFRTTKSNPHSGGRSPFPMSKGSDGFGGLSRPS